jgi:hypothetical protein
VRSLSGLPLLLQSLDTNLAEYADAASPIAARRRFSEFIELKDSLGVYSDTASAVAALPPLPPKSLLASMPSVVAARTSGFEVWLTALGNDPVLRLHPLVAAFMGARVRPLLPRASLPSSGRFLPL